MEQGVKIEIVVSYLEFHPCVMKWGHSYAMHYLLVLRVLRLQAPSQGLFDIAAVRYDWCHQCRKSYDICLSMFLVESSFCNANLVVLKEKQNEPPVYPYGQQNGSLI